MSLLAAAPALAQPPQKDPVDLIKNQYYEIFRNLPPSRKCTPDDTKGMWIERSIYETGNGEETAARSISGTKYISFGDYNLFLTMRSQVALDQAVLAKNTEDSDLQFITTVAGMLYVYRNNALLFSNLCYVTTGVNDNFKTPGLLMLAVPIQKDKPLSMTIFAPF